MLKLFAGKKLSIIGGTGYIGLSIAKRAATWGISVNAISRKGQPASSFPFPSNITFVKGSAMDPEGISEILKQSDAVIHTVGTLIDSTVFGGKKPGDPGSYEQMNRDTAIKIGNKLNDFNKKQKIVYISANKAPPILDRYIKTKREAEQHLLNLPGIRTTILRPGFVVSAKERLWSVPMKYLVMMGNLNTKLGLKVLPEGRVRRLVEKLDGDEPIELDDLTIAAIVSAFDAKYDGKILLGEEMKNLARNCIEKMA